MKAKVQLNDVYAKKLLSDSDFRNNLDLIINDQMYIEEIWISNHVIDNDEMTFRAQTLALISQHFCRIFEVQAVTVEIAHQDGTTIPTYLYKTGQMNPLRTIATITEFQID